MPRKYFRQVVTLILLTLGLFATVKAVKFGYQQFITAEEVSIPENIRITNLSDNSASISWITDKEIIGFVVWGTSPGALAQSQKPKEKSKIHHFTLRNLAPETLYYYKIGSGTKTYDNNGSPYTFTTAPIAPSPPTPDEVYGKVKNANGQPAAKVLVYLTLKDQDGQGSPGSSTTLSTVTSSSGSFIADLGNARTINLSNYYSYSREADQLEIEVEGVDQGKAKVILTTAQTQPLPEISLSQTGTLADLTGQALTEEQKTSLETRTRPQKTFEQLVPTVTQEEISQLQEAVKPKINLEPKTTLKPGDLISGTASPGATLTIKIESPEPLTAQITVNQDGTWSYKLPDSLTSGEHTITVSDAEGRIDSKSFILAAAAGEEISSSPSALPEAGFSAFTYLLSLIGLLFLLSGLKLHLTE